MCQDVENQAVETIKLRCLFSEVFFCVVETMVFLYMYTFVKKNFSFRFFV